MKILTGTIPEGFQGGVFATEAPFERELGKATDVFPFHFGRKVEHEDTFHRITTRLCDLVYFFRDLRTIKPDIVHLNSAFTKRALLRDPWYILIAKFYRCPIFIKYHGSDATLLSSSSSAFWKMLTAFCVRHASGIGALSSEEKENFLKAGFAGETIFVVKNTVDYTKFKPALIPPLNDKTRLLFISRLIPSKGLLDVIRAFAIVLRAKNSIELICVGDGPELPKAHELTRELGIEQNVIFTGLVSEEKTREYYLGSTMLVFPTTHGEGFSMVIFQSVAAGLPIITTRIRAAADYLTEPDNCLWVEPRNPEVLAQKITYLLDHPEVMANMSMKNRGLAKKFGPEQTAHEYLQIYQSLLSRKNR
jgi:glycosyltransferase involved in cell wall biosynthesis